MKRVMAAAAASLSFLSTQVGAQEDMAAVLLQDFDFANAEKIVCDPKAEKQPCIIEAWKKAAETGKAVVAFHLAPEHQTLNVVFPNGIVVQLERAPAAGPSPTV